MNSPVLAALASGVIKYGALALALLAFGAWHLGAVIAPKLVIAAACLAYLAQACLTLDAMERHVDDAHAEIEGLRIYGLALWLATLVFAGIAPLLVLVA